MTVEEPTRWNVFSSPRRSSTRPGIPAAIAIALLIAAGSALFQVAVFRANPGPSDFDQLHAASTAMGTGADPYTVVGPGRVFESRWPMYHPMPALVAVWPLTRLPLETARTVFVFLGAAALGFGVARRGGSWARWLVFVSASWQTTVLLVQWSAWLTAAALVPWIGVLLAVKPNIGVAVMSAARRWRDLAWPLAGGLLLIAISFALQPDWVPHWLDAVADNRMRSAPITRPWGWLLLLAALKWRRSESRLFLALACVSQTPHLYDLLLLFLIPATAIEHIGLVALSHLAMRHALSAGTTNGNIDGWLIWYGQLTILWMFLPCLLMLIRRPNEGPAPAWVERRIARWPLWLRGVPAAAGAQST